MGNSGATALYRAAGNGHEAAVRLLLEAKADVNKPNDIGETPLYEAAIHGHDGIVALLLGAGADVDAPDAVAFELQPAENGRARVVAHLLTVCADVTASGTNRTTPLFLAASEGHADVVAQLVAAGADANTRNQAGESAICRAASKGHVRVVEALELCKAVAVAARANHAPVMELLLRTATPVNGTPKALAWDIIANREVCLSAAVREGDVSQARHLLRQSTNPNVVDHEGEPLLHVALRLHRSDMAVELIHTAGTDVDCLSTTGRSALTVALQATFTAVVQALVMADADANLVDAAGATPLLAAIDLGLDDVAGLLIDANADVRIASAYPAERYGADDAQVDSSMHVLFDAGPIGVGASAVVYRGTHRGAEVAVKLSNPQGVDSVLSEIEHMTQHRSPYLVPLLAVSRSTKAPEMVLELMAGGDLRRYLEAKRQSQPTAVDVSALEVAWVVAHALWDLHDMGVMHRDLKSHNVLLCPRNYIKVADLGSAKDLQAVMTTGCGSVGWMAPEVLASGTSYGFPADIYSFGVLLTELDTLQPPFADSILSGFQIADAVRLEGRRPRVSSSCPPWMKDLVEACLAQDPAARPTAEQVVARLAPLMQRPAVASLQQIGSHAIVAKTALPGASKDALPLALTDRPGVKAAIPCATCDAPNALVATECSACGVLQPPPDKKLAHLAVRLAAVAGAGVDATIPCEACFGVSPLDVSECEHCHDRLPSTTEKLRILARRWDFAQRTVAT
ncbi:protein kinase [Achlya hypogyna]|uniref:Protein kinase n=1 Tax=Achlya hypogyna TaxID=1202772 RepID=A0A1V9ZRL2_ACHHY|nr:protein kinase [Achlya hypogyna]